MIDSEITKSITIDCAIFGFENGSLEVLVVKHAQGISKGKWGLPGGWILKNEDIDGAAQRLLKELTGLNSIYLEQLKAFGEPNRFPLGRVITIGYYALIQIFNYGKKIYLKRPCQNIEHFGLGSFQSIKQQSGNK